jgi:UDP-N-acetylmuramate dehydrogenase
MNSEKYPLQAHHTFGIQVYCDQWIEVYTPTELQNALLLQKQSNTPYLILGGGSNVLFTQDYPGTIICNRIGGIEMQEASDNTVLVTAGAGVVWHTLVSECVHRGLGGIENLALIPGTCGAAPIQNIGAYGVELKDVFHSLQALDTETGEIHSFHTEACHFGYRDSIYKSTHKGKYIILNITLRLHKAPHTLKTEYGAIMDALKEFGISKPGIQDIMEAVMHIRSTKLPDPKVTGNAGSFFKNPEIPDAQAHELKQRFPGLVAYPAGPGYQKIAAGWLIEQCGWKGHREGDAGVHPKQALVLVNYGQAAGNEIVQLAKKIQDSVLHTFGISLMPEVNIL